MNILYVTPYVPSQIRTRPYNLIRALGRLGHEVTLLTVADPEDEPALAHLRALGLPVEAVVVPRWRSWLNCLQALPTRDPLQAVYSYHPALAHSLRRYLRTDTFDLVHIEHLRAARLVHAVTGVPKVYDSVDCISLLFEQTAQTGPHWRARWLARLDLARSRRYEGWLLLQYDQAVISSARDREALLNLAQRYWPRSRPAPVTVVTNGVDLDYFRPQPEVVRDRHTVVFTGKMSYHANIAGARYFVQEVLPLIWSQDPDVRFQIVGKDPPEEVRRLAHDPRIQVTGTVPDLRPYLAQAGVAVCPIQYAVGIQNKILEALALATPVVCTPAAAAGLAAGATTAVRVAEDGPIFAQAVLQLLRDPGLADRWGRAGYDYVVAHHSWEAAARRLAEVYTQAVAASRSREQVG